MIKNESVYLLSFVLLALLITASVYSSSMTFAQTSPLPASSKSPQANGTNATNTSAQNLKQNLVNKLKTDHAPCPLIGKC